MGFGLALQRFEAGDHYHLKFLWWSIKLPWRSKEDAVNCMDSWGGTFYWDEQAIHWNWKDKCRIWSMPWAYDHCFTEMMLINGQFVPYEAYPLERIKKHQLDRAPEPTDVFRKIYLYRYQLKNGEIQEREATVTVERRTWYWRMFNTKICRRLGWPRMRRVSIDVKFSGEVGERTGTWKGGVIGTGYGMLPGETPEQTLRRMEREHKM